MRFVPITSLEAGMTLGRDIISNNQIFMLKRGVSLTEEYISFLSKNGYLGAYILDDCSEGIEPVEPVSTATISESIKSIQENNIPGMLQSAGKIVNEICDLEQLSIDIIDLRSFDDYTYHHSVNVAIFAVAVGKIMGLSEEELSQLAQAGICHDLGKLKIPIEIINKPGKLTDTEFEEIKKHPKYSYDILYDNNEVSPAVRQAVVMHHENENGSGYPYGKEAEQIPLLAKILHAVDVFDALTSRRPYKDPYTPYDAYEYMTGGTNILFNEKVVDAMRKVIPTFPVGMEVGLSTGVQAIVLANTRDPLKPVVRLKDAIYTLDLSDPENKDIFVVSSGYMSLEYEDRVEELNEKRQKVKEKAATILIVDDSALSLKQTASTLQKDEYNIICLQSGLAALNYLKTKEAPDLVIMDIEMPVLNGIAAVTSIRNLGFSDLPIIFLTAKVDKETVIKCKSVGAEDYIVKPFQPIYLRERVSAALGRTTDR